MDYSYICNKLLLLYYFQIRFTWLFPSSLERLQSEGRCDYGSLLLRLYHISIYDHHPDLSSRKSGGPPIRRYKSEMRCLITKIIWFIDFVAYFTGKFLYRIFVNDISLCRQYRISMWNYLKFNTQDKIHKLRKLAANIT